MDEYVEKQLKEIFSNFTKRPVAFIGSGISKRYLDTPTWIGLLKKTFNEYNSNIAEFGQMLRKYGDTHLDQVASNIENDYDSYFIHHICTNPNHKNYQLYLENKNAIDNGKIHPYKIYTANVFKQASLNAIFNDERNEFISFIGKCANIITTNYDTLLENISNLDTIIGSKDFISEKCIGYGELYKIHGCCSNPNSMVLTAEDYQNFNEKKSFYHAKLLLSFIQQPIIFLGYSLSDGYIEGILEDVAKMLDDEDLEVLSKRLVFVEYTETPQTSIREKIIKKLQMTCIRTNDYKTIYRLMSENVREGIPLDLVKRFQEAVKNFIYEQDNPKALPVTGINDIKDPRGLTAFHIGSKPVSDNSSLFTSRDLLNDILYNTGRLPNSDVIIDKIHSEALRFPREAFTPLYKYYNNSSKKYSLSDLSKTFITNVLDLKKGPDKYIAKNFIDLKQKIESSCNNENDVLQLLLKNIELCDSKFLRDTLTNIHPNPFSSEEKVDTKYRKLIAAIDFLENGQ
ncbi:MAG: SIR2 family protein [Roseburia sp.]|nr:SIR2 family protein [Anaeroplasma bactoclasticum]MCM1195534.1 SIR2 family protein [Roseburia sp.]